MIPISHLVDSIPAVAVDNIPAVVAAADNSLAVVAVDSILAVVDSNPTVVAAAADNSLAADNLDFASFVKQHLNQL